MNFKPKRNSELDSRTFDHRHLKKDAELAKPSLAKSEKFPFTRYSCQTWTFLQQAISRKYN